ncbi:unnamed protein product [Caenorhabditis bovis]|uniref:Uncharacterized protein n=1 Tax=Caenorhabditis bovis TaxID=2654633 RepID=A0A8S1FAC2_9PELO|nr:unnamed protein product [Caenorhabditis bovis]
MKSTAFIFLIFCVSGIECSCDDSTLLGNDPIVDVSVYVVDAKINTSDIETNDKASGNKLATFQLASHQIGKCSECLKNIKVFVAENLVDEKNSMLLDAKNDRANGFVKVGEKPFFCAVEKKCGATVPIYRHYRLLNIHLYHTYTITNGTVDGYTREDSPICYGWKVDKSAPSDVEGTTPSEEPSTTSSEEPSTTSSEEPSTTSSIESSTTPEEEEDECDD